MKTVSTVVVMTLLGVLSLPALADSGMHDMPGMKGQPMGEMKGHNMSGMGDKTQTKNTYRGQGTVNGVDAKAGKVNLSHGPIESLGWPAMTMGFPVKDAVMLEGMKSGMKVDFDLEKIDGKYRIVSITPSK